MNIAYFSAKVYGGEEARISLDENARSDPANPTSSIALGKILLLDFRPTIAERVPKAIIKGEIGYIVANIHQSLTMGQKL